MRQAARARLRLVPGGSCSVASRAPYLNWLAQAGLRFPLHWFRTLVPDHFSWCSLVKVGRLTELGLQEGGCTWGKPSAKLVLGLCGAVTGTGPEGWPQRRDSGGTRGQGSSGVSTLTGLSTWELSKNRDSRDAGSPCLGEGPGGSSWFSVTR